MNNINTVFKGQGRLEACSTCSKHTGAEGATTLNKAPNAIGNGAKRQMNTVKFWLEPALLMIVIVWDLVGIIMWIGQVKLCAVYYNKLDRSLTFPTN
jgi:hypothetical protein